MKRRTFLRAALAGGIGTLLTRGRGFGQVAQRPDSGDRLYDPSMVQARTAATAGDNDAVIKTLEHRLKCTCGCNLDIYTCRTTDFTCTYSPALHQEVLTLRKAGKQPEEIVAAFVTKYGEQVLMAPKPEGFNLAGYLIPGAAVLAAGGLLATVLLRRGRHAKLQPAAAGPLTAGNPADDERLRQALSEVED